MKKRKAQSAGLLDLSSAPSQVWSVGVETPPIVANMDGNLAARARNSFAVRRWCGGLSGGVVVKAQPSPARPKTKVAHLRVLSLEWAASVLPAVRERTQEPRGHPSPVPRLPVLVWIPLRPSESRLFSVIKLWVLWPAGSGRIFEILIPKRASKQAFSAPTAGMPQDCRCRCRKVQDAMLGTVNMPCIAVSRFTLQECRRTRVLVDNGRVSFLWMECPLRAM
ncbi:hypothetical protein QBC45DRAFT_400274 [Copromyces sp. CBS 386.78]|nr:hypothetical protein QBC45DRAFT_400274 [Copromyces sp. CBS 386.78]